MRSLARVPARSRRLLPAVVVVVAVLGAVGVFGARSGKGAPEPPVLRLASVTGQSVAVSVLPAATTSNGTASKSSPSGARWRLQATLPVGPSSGQVHLLPAGPTTGAFVRAVAQALGMSGQPQHLHDGWYLVSGRSELSVSQLTGRHWTYSDHGCVAGPLFDPQIGAACAVAQPPPPTPLAPGTTDLSPLRTESWPGAGPAPQPIPEEIARRVARPVLEAVGVNPASAHVEAEGDQRDVIWRPDVAGLRVLGLDTRVSIDRHAHIVDASGWQGGSTAGQTYPLISAQGAYDLLRQGPQPLMELSMAPCRILAGRQGCLPTPDRVVTGATLGLTKAYGTDRRILLVPAWLFQVSGEPTPLAVVAVERSFLGPPQPSAGGGPRPGGVPGAAGGTSGTNDTTKTTGGPRRLGPNGPTTAPAVKPPR